MGDHLKASNGIQFRGFKRDRSFGQRVRPRVPGLDEATSGSAGLGNLGPVEFAQCSGQRFGADFVDRDGSLTPDSSSGWRRGKEPERLVLVHRRGIGRHERQAARLALEQGESDAFPTARLDADIAFAIEVGRLGQVPDPNVHVRGE